MIYRKHTKSLSALPISFLLVFMSVSAAFATNKAAAEEIVIADDGSEILLNSDGSWIQLSRDRFATSKAGKRIRLSPDGQWQEVKERANLEYDRSRKTTKAILDSTSVDGDQTQQINELDLNLTNDQLRNASNIKTLLDKVEILTIETETLKSRRIDTRTVFHLAIFNNGNSNIALNANAMQKLSALTSRGRKLDILSMEFDQSELTPGNSTKATITADGSPRFFRTKFLALEIEANTFGDSPKQVLSKNMDQVVRRKVDIF